MRQTINVTGFLLLSAILAASGARPASACDADHLCGSRLCDWEDFDDNGRFRSLASDLTVKASYTFRF